MLSPDGREEGVDKERNACRLLNPLPFGLCCWAFERTQGKLDEAEEPMKQALAIFKKVLGEEHPNVATLLNNLAGLLRTQARF